MLPVTGAFQSPSMGCGGAASASARLACTSSPATTPRARPLAQPALSALSGTSQHADRAVAQTLLPDSACSMLPGLLHLRLGALAGAHGPAGAAARLRTSVRACAHAARNMASERGPFGGDDPACSGPASASTSFASAHSSPHATLRGLGTRSSTGQGLWSRHCTVAAAATPGPASSSPMSPLAAASAPLPASRHRQLSSRVDAGAAAGVPGSPSKKQQKQQQQQQKQQQQPVAQVAAGDAPAAAAASAPNSAVRYSPLHYNIEEFSTRVVPSEGEKRQRVEVIEAVRSGVRKVWGGARQVELQVFGSFANGLSTWNSDLDLVVTGVMEPDRISGGYELADRAKITSRLRKVAEALNRAKNIEILRQQLIPRARIPILKLWTKSRVCVDVSMSDDSGPRAARYMTQQCRAFPPLKPLVLVLKTYLKACRLNEVASGGLSSYSLTNMVIAHLQEELKAGHDISDLGETLYTFLLRYGEEHDYGSQAVSVGSGGIVPKVSLGYAMESARQAAASMGSYDGAVSWNERLFVDCPLTGRDVSNGTYRIDLVRGGFVQAARKLEALARGRRMSDTTLNYLQALFDVNRVLKRSYPDPYEPYEDEYLKVIGARGGAAGEDEEDEELLGGGGGTDGDDADLDGDYLERSPTATAAPASTSSAPGPGRGGQGRR